MEGGTVKKETDRVVKEITKNGATTYRAQVAVTNFGDFCSCATAVAANCPGAAVMLGAFVDKTILFSVSVPPTVAADVKSQWLSYSLAIVGKSANIVDNIWIDDVVHAASLVLTSECELTSEKLLDQIFGVATAFAKKSGLVAEEEEEEKEYTFDDI